MQRRQAVHNFGIPTEHQRYQSLYRAEESRASAAVHRGDAGRVALDDLSRVAAQSRERGSAWPSPPKSAGASALQGAGDEDYLIELCVKSGVPSRLQVGWPRTLLESGAIYQLRADRWDVVSPSAHSRKKRKKRYGNADGRGQIKTASAIVEFRIGDWEIDLVLGRPGTGALVFGRNYTLQRRQSKQAEPVADRRFLGDLVGRRNERTPSILYQSCSYFFLL